MANKYEQESLKVISLVARKGMRYAWNDQYEGNNRRLVGIHFLDSNYLDTNGLWLAPYPDARKHDPDMFPTYIMQPGSQFFDAPQEWIGKVVITDYISGVLDTILYSSKERERYHDLLSKYNEQKAVIDYKTGKMESVGEYEKRQRGDIRAERTWRVIGDGMVAYAKAWASTR